MLSLALAVRKTRLTWVNGIAYNLQHMQAGQKELSKLFGGKQVEFCHNPTGMRHGGDTFGYVADLAQAGTQKLGRKTEEVTALVKHLKDAVHAVGRRGRVIHIAHSQGALVTLLATNQLTPLEMNQMEVICFGGAAVLRKTPATPFSRVVNYYSINDPLLLVVPQAAQALRSGFAAAGRENDEFCFLAPRIGDPIQDHNLLGPTYLQALIWEGQRFQNQYQSLVYQSVLRPLWINTATGANVISQGLHELLKRIIRSIVIPILFLWACLWRVLDQPARVCLALLVAWIEQVRWTLNGKEHYQPAQVALELVGKK